MVLEDLLTYLPNLEQLENWFLYNAKEPLLFNSSLFLGLFLTFYFGYILMRRKFRMRLLYTVAFSLFFYYKSSGLFFLLLVGTTIVDYYLARLIAGEENEIRKKLYLSISVAANLGVLAYFKYTNFFLESINQLSGSEYHMRYIILPVGISFFTFQSISYIIEVYRKEIKLADKFIDYLFYISFFPQLVAGPIVRAKDFIPQIYSKVSLKKEEVNEALLLIIGGLIKKAVISDYISTNFVDRVFDAPNSYSAIENLLATYGYAIQIYCDFSGYSDMEIGLALLLGYRLPINFDVPYQSASITEFWRRWHISLSTWLRDFLYISVGGNRKGTFAGYFFPALFFVGTIIWGIWFYDTSAIPLYIAVGSVVLFLCTIIFAQKSKQALFTNFNLLTTMLLGGLWHGASLRFIIWGALHGLALAFHKLFMEIFPKMENLPKWWTRTWHFISVLITFHFVSFCWIFFRARDFDTALSVIYNIGGIEWNPEKWQVLLAAYKPVMILLLAGFVWHFMPKRLVQGMGQVFSKSPLPIKAVVISLVFWLVYATASTGPQPFIYFQF